LHDGDRRGGLVAGELLEETPVDGIGPARVEHVEGGVRAARHDPDTHVRIPRRGLLQHAGVLDRDDLVVLAVKREQRHARLRDPVARG